MGFLNDSFISFLQGGKQRHGGGGWGREELSGRPCPLPAMEHSVEGLGSWVMAALPCVWETCSFQPAIGQSLGEGNFCFL